MGRARARQRRPIRGAILLGAQQVIAIDNVPERLAMAQAGGATTINFSEESVIERLNDLTHGKGPEKCIDAVGMEAHAGGSIDAVYDKVKQSLMLETDRPHVIREMMYVCLGNSVLEPPCALDMGTPGGRCARYRHARNRIAPGQSEKRECRTCPGRRRRRYGAGRGLRSLTRASFKSEPASPPSGDRLSSPDRIPQGA
jgi:hypothetical protein